MKKYELFIGNKNKSQLQTLANYKVIENVIKNKKLTHAIFEMDYMQKDSAGITIFAGYRIEIHECDFEDLKEIVNMLKQSMKIEDSWYRYTEENIDVI